MWPTGPVSAHSGLVAVIRADDVLQDAHVSPAVQQTTAVSIRQEVRQQGDIMHRVSFQNKGSTLYNIISHVVYNIKYEVNDLNVHTWTEYVELQYLQHASTPSASGLTLMVCVVLYVRNTCVVVQ